MTLASAFDSTAPTFERHRGLPDGVAEAIRAAVLAAVAAPSPRLLDVGAGTGRIGRPFVAAGDDYVGLDLSLGMLRAFARGHRARLVQADGARLPFRDATFDAVILIQVFGGMGGWRKVLAEARRVLRAAGAIIVGRTVAPPDGVDARMKWRLDQILDVMGVERNRANVRDDVLRLLAQSGRGMHVDAAAWTAERTPRGFLERHATGARFAALPAPIKDEALRRLGAWAESSFGSLDTAIREPHSFELQVFRFQTGPPT
ncbi:MAG TPA: class I SAM-dependent methyltransferase [Xanthobacteraceae bacterium]|nr:class I SAM-dependent methyltransferase [Xanthobacteraceae bacterium]